MNSCALQYTSGILMIRFNELVLEPTGAFQVGSTSTSPTEASGTQSGFLWWHYVLFSVGAAVLVLALLAIVVSEAVRGGSADDLRSSGHHRDGEHEDCKQSVWTTSSQGTKTQ